jgi:molybdopterin/thiamine biosynthesis adenylyltransferase
MTQSTETPTPEKRSINITIIGLGGVGSILTGRLCRFLNFSREFEPYILLVDGDRYEPKNLERQEFTSIGENKAESKAFELSSKFSRIDFDVFDSYVNEGNVKNVIQENTIVFICVDNHKSRRIINNYCKTLNNVTVISGGNEFTDGNTQLYIRRGGEDITPDLCKYHPEIESSESKLPDEMSCEELSMSEPQLYFANLGVATLMCWMFYNSVVNNQYDRSESYFDLLTMSVDSKVRIVK